MVSPAEYMELETDFDYCLGCKFVGLGSCRLFKQEINFTVKKCIHKNSKYKGEIDAEVLEMFSLPATKG